MDPQWDSAKSDRIDATSDKDIQEQIEHDNDEVIVDMGEYIRGVRALLRIIDKSPEVAVTVLQR